MKKKISNIKTLMALKVVCIKNRINKIIIIFKMKNCKILSQYLIIIAMEALLMLFKNDLTILEFFSSKSKIKFLNVS